MNIFNSRFDLESASPNGTDIWDLSGTVVDNSGNFSASDVVVGDIIYNDGSALALGPLRYKITNILSVVGSTISCTVLWDIPGESSQEPVTAAAGCIGRPDSNGVIPITDAMQQSMDTAFANAVRNMESFLLSKRLTNIPAQPGMMYKDTYDKNKDSIIDIDVLPILDMGSFK